MMGMLSFVYEIRREIENYPARSAWRKGVREYAEELFDFYVRDYRLLKEDDLLRERITEEELLNGAENWHQYSWGGCSLIYDSDICERLCTKRVQEQKHHGELPPGKGREWLDEQAQALEQAAKIVMRVANAQRRLPAWVQ